jgi:PQQ-dependent dehydrogenase (methanol/ethanol family)
MGNGHEQQFYSPLTQINDKNVQQLGLAWSADLPTQDGLVGNPLVADGVVYQSGSMNRVYANDVRTGKLLWTFDPQYSFEGGTYATVIGARLNRGLAIWEDKVLIGTGDCRMIAVDRKTGAKVWDVVSCDKSEEYRMQTGAPHVGGGLVFTGNSCIDSGLVRGYVTAYDIKTGQQKWRFYTVPGDPSKPQDSPLYDRIAKTWGTDWWKHTHGCGGVYEPITYDEKLNLVYLGVGGVSPFNPTMRAPDAGDELFTNSIVAVKADTGEYVWHYKLTPHDAWNFEPMQIMVADLPIEGKTRRVILEAPKSGFFYVLDAANGKFISADKFTTENWASRIDQKTGRPVPIPDANYWEKPDGAVVWGGPLGLHGTQAMAFNPATHLVYIPVHNLPVKMVQDKTDVMGGTRWVSDYEDDKIKRSGELVAYDPIAQKARWRVKHEMAVNGGVMSTAGNLVFQGTAMGKLEARRADTGELLWSGDVGTAILAAPTTVEVDGEQLLLVSVGNGGSGGMGRFDAKFSACDTCLGPPRLLAFKLGGTAALTKVDPPPPFPKPPRPPYPEELANRGAGVFMALNCDVCHGTQLQSVGGFVPDLRRASMSTHDLFSRIVHEGLLKTAGMPQFADATEDDLRALQAFIINGAWKAYNAQEQAKH